ncbi:serine/threonine-protein kinase [Streptomyces sp. NBC_01257]|uniref:serine/threonine-protein kinase n=1 Tax=Streptomyces sp. NBC_01257 TaxID=2903799 RepID=UPI002DDAB56D|nr:protein kinase [Streptomyces sp. NBC_01257]WRZ65738.1 protein kinase [Streptomyces sp. NBC_01257]
MEKLGSADPQRIGAYRLLGRLGAGGMGQVYLARSDRGRVVAIKLVREELAERQEFRDRFRQEVLAARRVGSTWTAPVLDADTEAAVPWVATGYVAGPSLQATVSGRASTSAGPAPGAYGPLPHRSVHILGTGLAHALRAIHAAGLIHRDLKPSNILLTIDGPRVIDFGIARALDTVTDGGLTRTGALVGSPGFMSPEQVRGERVTTACDVFCLGSVLAYAATGRLPFGVAASGVHALMFRIAQEDPDLTGVPADLVELIRHCLHKDPGARPSTDEILARLDGGDTVEPWLPGALIAQLGRHAVGLLDSEDPMDAVPPAPAPADTAPAEAAPAPAPADTVPNDGVPTDAVPNDTVPNDTVPHGAVPHDAVPDNAAPGGTAPVHAAAANPPQLPAGPPPVAPAPPVPSAPSAPPATVVETPAPAAPPAPSPAEPSLPGASFPAYGYPQQPAQPYPVQGYGVPQQPAPNQGYAYGYPQQPGFGSTPPYGPAHPAGGQPTAPARRSTGSTIALVVIAVLVAIGAGGSVYALMNDRDATTTADPTRSAGPSPADDSSNSPSPDGPPDPSPSDDAQNGDDDGIPEGYLGTWSGSIDNAAGHSTRELVIRQGQVGDAVLTLTAEGPMDTGGTYRCVFQADLASVPSEGEPVSVGPSTVTLGEPMTSCTPGSATTLTLLPDGTLSRLNTDSGEKLTYTKTG